MLYRAAFGKSIPPLQKSKLQKLSQKEINKLVLSWAVRAGWKTEEKIGTDSAVYIAFYPSISTGNEVVC